jgi:hypothetical protein
VGLEQMDAEVVETVAGVAPLLRRAAERAPEATGDGIGRRQPPAETAVVADGCRWFTSQ